MDRMRFAVKEQEHAEQNVRKSGPPGWGQGITQEAVAVLHVKNDSDLGQESSSGVSGKETNQRDLEKREPSQRNEGQEATCEKKAVLRDNKRKVKLTHKDVK